MAKRSKAPAATETGDNEPFMEAAERDPKPTDFGFNAYGDAPGGIGGGVATFFWYPSRDKMLQAIADRILEIWGPRPGSDPEKVASQVRLIIGDILKGNCDEAKGLARLNKTLRGSTRILWWGKFRDLLSGDSAFAAELRREHFDLDDDAPAPPIPSDELDDFKALLLDPKSYK